MRILCYGDSNTFGTAPMRRMGEDARHPPGVRWADQMAAALPDATVMVQGLPGRTTVFDDPMEGAYRNGLTVLPAILHSLAPIDLMILCLGTNDQKRRFSLGARDIALGVRRLVREAAASGVVARTLVVCPPPAYPAGDLAAIFHGADRNGPDLADEITRFATEEGADVLDASALISVDPLDGVHWSAEAHATLGAALADKVRSLA